MRRSTGNSGSLSLSAGKKPVSGYRKEMLGAFEEKLKDFGNIPFLPESYAKNREKSLW